MKKAVMIFFSLLMMFGMAGCHRRPAFIGILPGEEEPSVAGLYQLRSMDPLEISLLGIPEEKNIETIVDERGNITLPYIDAPIKAEGLTTSELERAIQRIYTEGQIYRSITINVITHAKSYYMEGEVRRPQEYPLNRRITLLQAIAAASGYTEYANKRNITITRQGQIIRVNARDIELNPEWDIPIEAGDRINVQRSFF